MKNGSCKTWFCRSQFYGHKKVYALMKYSIAPRRRFSFSGVGSMKGL